MNSTSQSHNQTAILLVDAPDRKGLVAAIHEFLYRHDANILHADQHQDNLIGLFFMRVEWDLRDFDLNAAGFAQAFQPLAAKLNLRWRLEYSAKPYHAAFDRGVKLIGATSHYVTDDLDEGPIIEQDVTRISHRDQVADLIEKGKETERIVLSRAVKWHLEHRILGYENKTVVFD